MESQWQRYQLEDLLVAILASTESRPEAGHHLGPPYLTAYQLAIELANRHPEIVSALGYPLGGAGVGQHSLLGSTRQLGPFRSPAIMTRRNSDLQRAMNA